MKKFLLQQKVPLIAALIAAVGLLLPAAALALPRQEPAAATAQSVSQPRGVSTFAATPTPCSGKTFLGRKTWHDGLDKDPAANCAVKFTNPASFVWTIVLNVLYDLLVFAGAWAVVMIIWNGYQYTTAGGDSAKLANAKSGLVQVIVGLAIAVLSATVVNFVTGRLTK